MLLKGLGVCITLNPFIFFSWFLRKTNNRDKEYHGIIVIFYIYCLKVVFLSLYKKTFMLSLGFGKKR